jgi:hypothetical protein
MTNKDTNEENQQNNEPAQALAFCDELTAEAESKSSVYHDHLQSRISSDTPTREN